MRTTAAEHRAKQRKVLAWSFMSAFVLHVAVLVFIATRTIEPEPRTSAFGVSSATSATGERLSLEVHFGPPTIATSNGISFREPPNRRLKTIHVTTIPAGCDDLFQGTRSQFSGDVRLLVRESGFVDAVELTRGTGLPCADAVLRSVAGALRYHWLPNERFPAPVDLVQPVAFAAKATQ